MICDYDEKHEAEGVHAVARLVSECEHGHKVTCTACLACLVFDCNCNVDPAWPSYCVECRPDHKCVSALQRVELLT